MSGPADDSAHGEDGCEEVGGDAHEVVDNTRVEVDVGKEAAFLGEAFRGGFFHVLGDVEELGVA